MPKIDISKVTVRKGCPYPPPFDAPCAGTHSSSVG